MFIRLLHEAGEMPPRAYQTHLFCARPEDMCCQRAVKDVASWRTYYTETTIGIMMGRRLYKPNKVVEVFYATENSTK